MRTIVIAAIAFTSLAASICRADLTIGMLNVGWEGKNGANHNIDTGPFLFRNVPESDLLSVRIKITSQTVGNWSQAGILLRNPNSAPIDGLGANEDWLLNLSFRTNPSAPTNKAVNGINGTDTDTDNTGLAVGSVDFLRIDRVGNGQFRLYRGAGTDSNITWTQHSVGLMTNADLAGANLEVGITGGDYKGGAGGTSVFDWVEIQTTGGTYFDDFNYNRDFGVNGVPGFNAGATTGGAIWNGVYNATQGGTNTSALYQVCTTCNWSVDDGDWNNPSNWGANSEAPSSNTTVAVFTNQAFPLSITYTNVPVTVKELRFENTNKNILAGAGQIALDSDAGNAQINVNTGSHEIQVGLSLADDVTATAALGTSLDINSHVHLNGHTFNMAGAGTIRLNNGTLDAGSAAGALVNAASLTGLQSLAGDLTQTDEGSLGVVAGDSAIHVDGDAVLAGQLDVTLASGFSPIAGATYTVLTADSIVDQGLSLGGPAGSLFRLSLVDGAVNLTAVPEPGVVSLALVACCGALCITRPGNRRRR